MKAHRHAPSASSTPSPAPQAAPSGGQGNAAAQEDLLSSGALAPLPHAARMAAAFDDLPVLSAVLGDTEGGAEHDANAWVEDGVPHFASLDPDAETVAHELAHVVQEQQSTGGAASATSRPGDAAESEASDVAANVAAGGEAGPVEAQPTGRLHRDFDFDWGKALAVTKAKAELTPEDKEQITAAKDDYMATIQTIGAKYFGISQQQGIALGELKTAAAKQDPKGLTEQVITGGIELAIGKIFAHMGTEMAAGVVETLRDPWKNAFSTTGAAASTAAKAAVSGKFATAPNADVFFDGMAAGYVGIASQQQDVFVERSVTAWRGSGAEYTVATARKLAADARQARDLVTQQIQAKTHMAITKREAFDAWMVAVARNSLGTYHSADGSDTTNMEGAAMYPLTGGTNGVLYVYVTLGLPKPGQAKPWRVEAPGMTAALLEQGGVGSGAGRNLRDLHLPKQLVCTVPGGDQTFQVGVNEAGKIWVNDPTKNWLILRAGGDVSKKDQADGIRGAKLLVEEDLATQTLGGLFPKWWQ